MTILGLILTLATLGSMLFLICIQKILIKFSKKRLFFLLIGLFALIYFIAARYVWDVKELINFDSTKFQGSQLDYSRSVRFSKVLLLDMCPLSIVLLSFGMIFDKTKNIAKVIAPVAIIGGLITIFGSILFMEKSEVDGITVERYIFLGTDENRIFFLMHYLLCVNATIVLIYSKRFRLKSFFGTSAFYVLFLAYELIIIKYLHITNNATGLVVGDWVGPVGWYCEYGKMYEIWKLPFPAIVIFWYFIALLGNFIICLLKNFFTKDKNLIIKKENIKYFKFIRKEK